MEQPIISHDYLCAKCFIVHPRISSCKLNSSQSRGGNPQCDRNCKSKIVITTLNSKVFN